MDELEKILEKKELIPKGTVDRLNADIKSIEKLFSKVSTKNGSPDIVYSQLSALKIEIEHFKLMAMRMKTVLS